MKQDHAGKQCLGCKRSFGDKVKYHGSGRCATCDMRRRKGLPDGPVGRQITHCKKCFASFEFEKPYWARGMCKKCYGSKGIFKQHEECKKCGVEFSQAKRNREKHSGHGLCRRCYDKLDYRKKTLARKARQEKKARKLKISYYWRNREHILECRKVDWVLRHL